VGNYILTYTVSDAAGNSSTLSRVVIVQADTTAPVITLIGQAESSIAVTSRYLELGASASDDIDGDLSANIVTSGAVDPYTLGDYTLTYSVSDAAGNNASASRIVHVVGTSSDLIPPVITLLGNSPMNVEQNGVYNEAGASANDNVDGDLSRSIQISGNVDTFTLGQYEISYTVSDAAGNIGNASRTVTVVVAGSDTLAPVITLLGSANVAVNIGDAYQDAGASASDETDGDISSQLTVVNPVNTTVAGIYSVTYSVSDAAGNSSSASREVVVADAANSTPEIIGNPDLTVIEEQSYLFNPVGTDADGDTLIYSIQNKPSWASFNSTTGRLSGLPNTSNTGLYPNIVITVTDGKAVTALPPFEIIVTARGTDVTVGVGGGGGSLNLFWLISLMFSGLFLRRRRA